MHQGIEDVCSDESETCMQIYRIKNMWRQSNSTSACMLMLKQSQEEPCSLISCSICSVQYEVDHGSQQRARRGNDANTTEQRTEASDFEVPTEPEASTEASTDEAVAPFASPAQQEDAEPIPDDVQRLIAEYSATLEEVHDSLLQHHPEVYEHTASPNEQLLRSNHFTSVDIVGYVTRKSPSKDNKRPGTGTPRREQNEEAAGGAAAEVDGGRQNDVLVDEDARPGVGAQQPQTATTTTAFDQCVDNMKIEHFCRDWPVHLPASEGSDVRRIRRLYRPTPKMYRIEETLQVRALCCLALNLIKCWFRWIRRLTCTLDTPPNVKGVNASWGSWLRNMQSILHEFSRLWYRFHSCSARMSS